MPAQDPESERSPFGFLGIEAGGTRSSACWLDGSDTASSHLAFGPANLQLSPDVQILQLLRAIADRYPAPAAVGIGMAGTRTAQDRARLRSLAAQVWPATHVSVTHDLDSALAAAPPGPDETCDVLVLSGTGSCCYARNPTGESARVGGWGHVLGDQGSGYDIALRALRKLVRQRDQSGRWGRLGQAVLAHLHRNEPDELVSWIHSASKADIAALAPVVFTAAADADPIAATTLREAAVDLADDALACARKLARRRQPVRFVFAGSVLTRQPVFARTVRLHLNRALPKAQVVSLTESGAVGAARLARRSSKVSPSEPHKPHPRRPPQEPSPIPDSPRLSPTELRNPKSRNLDRLTPEQAVDLMLREDARIPGAILKEKAHLLVALDLIHAALARGGRLFYVGAGTSGRLGILDASECPPTFRTPPEWVQGVIAGGFEAVFHAVEGAEDDIAAGARALEFRNVSANDVVVGIAASGRTPFVWGALAEARKRGAATILVCFNPHLVFAPNQKPDVVIAPAIGPELLTGSTRLKSGTATKLILNLFTTLTMVRLGKVISNLMVDLNPANLKLRDRAIRITRELTGADATDVRTALENSGWIVKDALRSLGRKPTP